MGRLQILRLMPSHTQFYRKLQAYGKVHDKILKDIIRNESERLESTTMREGCSLQEKNKSTVSRIEKHKLSQKEENDNENKIKAVKRIRESLQTIEDGNDNGSFEPPISAFAKHKALRLKTIPVISEPEVISEPILFGGLGLRRRLIKLQCLSYLASAACLFSRVFK